MAKKLEDFVVEINLQGWYTKQGTYRAGQKFKGAEITERMIQAVETEETYTDRKTGKTHLVVDLLGGGSSKELRAAFDAYEPAKPVIEPAPKVAEVVEEPKEEKEEKEEKKKPVRRARPTDE